MSLLRIGILAFLVTLLTACVTVASTPFLSPLVTEPRIQTEAKRVYIPVASYNIAKKGLALNRDYCDDATRLGAAWIYNWDYMPPSCWYTEAVPMLWSPKQIGLPIAQGRYLLGFNECDRSDQCNTSAQDAAHDWRQVETLYYNRLLISPAPSSDDIDWLRRFREAYIAEYKVAPRLYALAAHCYLPSAAECITLGEQYVQWAKEWQVPGGVWFTEWAFGPCRVMQAASGKIEPNMLVAKQEAIRFQAWLEAEPVVTRYAWFTNRLVTGDSGSYPDLSCDTVLMDKNGTLTELGKWYAQDQNQAPDRE